MRKESLGYSHKVTQVRINEIGIRMQPPETESSFPFLAPAISLIS